jgi:HK97 family phage prohead protease
MADFADPGYQKDGQKRYPLDSEEHVRAAWSYINMPKNAAFYTAGQVASIKGRIKAAGKKYGITFAADAQRSAVEPTFFHRSFPLEDIHIQRTGDGRTVEAYAAVFHQEAEIRDPQGHYLEVIDPTAFNRTLSDSAPQGSRSTWAVSVFYNHARDRHGNSSDRFSVPIGTPEAIRADTRGLVTVTRYNKSDLAEEILEAIRNQSITGQSFTGRIGRSDPDRRMYKPSPTGQLQRVRRLELGLTEYGPTPMPAYQGAGILSVRSLSTALPGDSAQGDIPDPAGDATDDSQKRSARLAELTRKTRVL